MKAWLFQANPSRFDIDAFLSSGIVESEWIVSRYASELSVGDRVFLWRSGSVPSQPAGVFAEAELITPARNVPDDSPPEFWADPNEAADIRTRARILLKRVANKREVIKRDWWKVDPILHDHLIMRMANHTTFKLEPPHRERLEHLWSKTGSDWTYADAVAGLYAYVETLGKEVSKLAGSPVAKVSLLVGRPVSGIYNKVMNFRSIDPTDPRAGFDGASAQDKSVWAKFYDSDQGLDITEVRREFDRLWSADAPVADEHAARQVYEAEADQLASALTLDQLMDRWLERAPKKPKRPRMSVGTTRLFDRDPLVAAIARTRANFRCEVPECPVVPFIDKQGVRYVEVHHIDMLAEGGADTPENVVCLCPVHHREVHHGKGAKALTALLKQLRGKEPGASANGQPAMIG